jgi:hypothetical protein
MMKIVAQNSHFSSAPTPVAEFVRIQMVTFQTPLGQFVAAETGSGAVFGETAFNVVDRRP